MKIAVWTFFMFIISSGWAFLMLGLGAGEMGGEPSSLLVLFVAIYGFLSTPVSTIWIIGILIVICREIVKIEKESKKKSSVESSSFVLS
jgi:hypothetical protein